LHFAPDTEDDLAFLVVLCNTDAASSRSGTDELATPDDLAAILAAFTYSGRIDRDLAELAEVKRVRRDIRAVWRLPIDELVIEVNRILADSRALPQLERHDHFDWHFHATAPDAPLAERIRVEAAMSFSDIIRAGETARLRVCEADDCDGLLADLSRNGSKRFCSVRCGNRMNMVAFRQRVGS
jgi:predicted RNA-binding Zn ribbon-like protein